MKLLFIKLAFLFFFINFAHSKEFIAAAWKENSKTLYSECNVILSFICSSTLDVKPNVNFASINDNISIFDKRGELITKFKVKKIEYKNNRCWLTPQPIRKFTTYFTTDNCIAR